MSQRETILDVAGMTCSSCVRHVSAALRAVPGVSRAEVQLKAGTVSVWHEASASTSRLLQALSEAGYDGRLQGESLPAASRHPG